MRSNAMDCDNARESARRIFFAGRQAVLNDLRVGSSGVVRRLVKNFEPGVFIRYGANLIVSLLYMYASPLPAEVLTIVAKTNSRNGGI